MTIFIYLFIYRHPTRVRSPGYPSPGLQPPQQPQQNIFLHTVVNRTTRRGHLSKVFVS